MFLYNISNKHCDKNIYNYLKREISYCLKDKKMKKATFDI